MMAAFLPADVVTRALWALTIIAAGLALYWLLNRAILFRAQKNSATANAAIPGARSGVPAILYFTTPECVPCKTVQRPALKQIQARMGDQLQVIEINAQERTDLASRWGVLSVPTTFVIDERGQVRYVNHGATRADKLLQQLNN
jgi:thioredoxin-like negative regulator of GroEL